jgi:hypothetical protein
MTSTMTSAYLVAYNRTSDYFKTIQVGNAPARFTQEHLINMGFKAKNDRLLMPMLKALGFLDDNNKPTKIYMDFLDRERGKIVLGKQILNSYQPLFELNKEAHKLTASQLEDKFKTLVNASASRSTYMAQTFLKLCAIADIEGARKELIGGEVKKTPIEEEEPKEKKALNLPLGLNYHIEIHLPNTTDITVFRAIFKAMREHLL